MGPKRQTITDRLTEDEKGLLTIAVQLNSTLRYREQHIGAVDDEWYNKCIREELDEVNEIFDKYPDKNDSPRIHPIITYVGEDWDSTKDVNSLQHTAVLTLCEEGAVEHPSWNPQFHMQDLSTLLEQQPPSDRWWLPATHVDDEPGVSNETSHCAPAPTPEAPAAEEDVEMEEDDGGETPCKTRARKRAVVMSPPVPVECHGTRRQRVSSTGESVFISDLGACGPCQQYGKKCVPQPGSKKTLACDFCTGRKLKCDPLSAWAKAIQDAGKMKSRKRSVVDTVEDSMLPAIEAIRTEVRVGMGELRDVAYNGDTMLHALCA